MKRRCWAHAKISRALSCSRRAAAARCSQVENKLRLTSGCCVLIAGEKQIETDKRLLRDRISALRKDLESVRTHRWGMRAIQRTHRWACAQYSALTGGACAQYSALCMRACAFPLNIHHPPAPWRSCKSSFGKGHMGCTCPTCSASFGKGNMAVPAEQVVLMPCGTVPMPRGTVHQCQLTDKPPWIPNAPKAL